MSEFLRPKVNSVSMKRSNSGRISGKPPEFPDIASMKGSADIKKRDAGSVKKPK